MLFGIPKSILKLTKSGIQKPPLGNDQQRRRAVDKPPTKARIKQMYRQPASFTNLMPWLEYGPEGQCFLLDDGISVAALFEVEPVATEGRTEEYLREFRDKLQTVLTSLPEEYGNPWVVQFYLQDVPGLSDMAKNVRGYVKGRARDSELTKSYLDTLEAHFKAISQPGGLFNDKAVTGSAWRGQDRKIRITLYRRNKTTKGQRGLLFQSPTEELNDVASKLLASLNASGVRAKRSGGEALYEWLFRWFNPNPETTEGDIDGLLRLAPYPGDQDMPFGFDFSESLMLGTPHSDRDKGIWWFDGLAHKVVTVQSLRNPPLIGLLSSERMVGEHIYATFDRAPEDTILVITVVIRAQDEVRNHLHNIQHAAVGDNPEAKLAGQDAEAAQMEMAKGNKLFPVQMAFFLRGNTEGELRQKANSLNSLLLANNIQPIQERDDLLTLDSYIRNLPMAFSYEYDKKTSRRSRLMFSKQVASLIPLYGRSTGTGNPGVVFYNRGAEPLSFDPLNILDRKKNGHLLLLGPTGAGKSATLVYMILHLVAIYLPRVFIIEIGGSFRLLGDYFKSKGVSVNQVTLNPGVDVSLPPFGEALKLLDEFNKKARREQQKAEREKALLRNLELGLDSDIKAETIADGGFDGPQHDFQRDLLGEMEIAARMMITGGDVREDERMTRADRLLIRHAIFLAAENVQARGGSQVLTEDVVKALRTLPELDTGRQKDRASEMAAGMELFCDGLSGHFFNRPGSLWPDVDVTIVDMGILSKQGYEDQLSVAYMGFMNHIHSLGEQHQHSNRPTIFITDEGHLITTNPLLSPYAIKVVKLFRKLGVWYWVATHGLEDFPDVSRKMLAMLEWWVCLVMDKDDIQQIARFKNLNAEQQALLLAAKKSPGLYTEGVAITDEMTTLFRNVPPALALALAMTEQSEKAQRAGLMREHQCTELEAVLMVAKEIELRRSTKK
ncbi:MAG: conjugative transfer ATPase [Methylococcales bacterium]